MYQIMVQLHEMYLLGFRNFDIKPSNIIVDFNGNAKIVDLGSCELNKNVQNNYDYKPGYTELYSTKYIYLKKHY